MTTPELPQLRLKSGRDKPVRQGHPWIFTGAVQHMPDEVRHRAPDGCLVDVVAADGEWLARGYLNRRSQICVRLLSWERETAVDATFWRNRLAAALARREHIAAAGHTVYRAINAESDYVPGLTVDRYGDWLVMQVGTLGIDVHKRELAQMLQELSGCCGVMERSEASVRRQEGLPESSGLLAGERPPATVQVIEHGLTFDVDLSGGQKGGFYADQRENRQRVAAYAAGKQVLNAFSYTGAFGVYALAAGATHVTNVDTSGDALALAVQNVADNGLDASRSTQLNADVFQQLRTWRDHGERAPRFDLIILDPPKFAQNKRAVERALRGYKDINLLAMKLATPNAILATFSCSGLVSAELFQKAVFAAAVDAGRSVQILEWLHQPADHPVAITFPEGEYLKGFICRVI
jgi:23S rRNA (cytosine1962-C5)-methyltransferase